MSHRVKVGDKIRILKDEANGTNEKAGTILIVKSVIDGEFGAFNTTTTVFSDATCYFDSLSFDLGDIELVKEEYQTIGSSENNNVPLILSSDLKSYTNLTSFEHDRLSFMRNQAKKCEWVQMGTGDIEMLDKILGKE